MEPKITLAIESAIAGGSISIIRGGVEIATHVNTESVSRAEDLLFNIDALLRSNQVDKRMLGLIAVSAGPGSFTGIRIGLATAMGLRTGLGIPMATVSALQAIALAHGPGELTAAVPAGRNNICLQTFLNGEAMDAAVAVPAADFTEMIESQATRTFVVHTSLFEPGRQNMRNFGANIAFAVGAYCAAHPTVRTKAMFIAKAN